MKGGGGLHVFCRRKKKKEDRMGADLAPKKNWRINMLSTALVGRNFSPESRVPSYFRNGGGNTNPCLDQVRKKCPNRGFPKSRPPLPSDRRPFKG